MFILGPGLAIAAGALGATGIGAGVNGMVKASDANDTMQQAEVQHKRNIEKFERQSKKTNAIMDQFGKFELQILKRFEEFSNVIEQIQNRPEFEAYGKQNVSLPKYDKEELQNVSVGASVLLGALGGAAAGTAGALAAAGATTSAVMALGTASTGTAISSLSGAALTNATLAALGGGAVAAGGGGIALGTVVLNTATLGVGLLVGGLIVNATGNKLSKQADEAWSQMKKAEKSIQEICEYLVELEGTVKTYSNTLRAVNNKYLLYFRKVSQAVNDQRKFDWNDFTEEEKLATQNAVLLVGLLYKMCQVKLVKQSEKENELNSINHKDIDMAKQDAEIVMKDFNV